MSFDVIEHLNILIPVTMLLGTVFAFGLTSHVRLYSECKSQTPDPVAIRRETIFRNLGYSGTALILAAVIIFFITFGDGSSDYLEPQATLTVTLPTEHIQAGLNASGYYVDKAVVSSGTYSGYINPETGKPNGKGKMEYKTGEVYDGEWEEGIRSSYGTMMYKNGDRYGGSRGNGMRNGHGTYTWADNKSYDGGYVDGKRNGEGTFDGWVDEDTGTEGK